MKIGRITLLCWTLLMASTASAATPTRGTVYVGTVTTGHSVYKIDYAYDGADTLTTSEPVLLSGAPGGSYGYAVIPHRYLLVVGQGQAARIKLATGEVTRASPNNNGNTVVMDPDGVTAWAGWKDTALSSIPLEPFGDGTPHAVSGDDGVATEIAFTPTHGVFYTTGGEDRNGNVGTIDMTTFHATRALSNTEATGIRYDPFSDRIIFAAFGKAHEIDPANPNVILSSRDDSADGDYKDLVPDGMGHLLAARYGATTSALVLLDYTETGLIGDPSTRYVSAPIAVGGVAGLAYDPILFSDDFEP